MQWAYHLVNMLGNTKRTDNQLKDKEPECTMETFNKLLSLGYSEKESKEMLCEINII
jgi:Holliday junction resolvasome RuvABC DNA-binding subunit